MPATPEIRVGIHLQTLGTILPPGSVTGKGAKPHWLLPMGSRHRRQVFAEIAWVASNGSPQDTFINGGCLSRQRPYGRHKLLTFRGRICHDGCNSHAPSLHGRGDLTLWTRPEASRTARQPITAMPSTSMRSSGWARRSTTIKVLAGKVPEKKRLRISATAGKLSRFVM